MSNKYSTMISNWERNKFYTTRTSCKKENIKRVEVTNTLAFHGILLDMTEIFLYYSPYEQRDNIID